MAFIILLTVLLITFYYWKYRRFFWLASKIPGPFGLPILGISYKFLFGNEVPKVVKELSAMAEDSSPIKFWIGHKLFIYTRDPAQVDGILSNLESFDKGDSYNFMVEGMGYGLVTMKNSEQWKIHRKYLNPSFKYNVVSTYYPIVNKKARSLVHMLDTSGDSANFNLKEVLRICALDILSETTVGLNLQTGSEENLKFFKAIEIGMFTVSRRLYCPWLQPDFLFRLSKYYEPYKADVRFVKNIINRNIEEKKKEYIEMKQLRDAGLTKIDNDNFDEEMKRNLLADHMLKLSLENGIFNNSEVLEEMRTIIFAGYETTATAIFNSIMLLALYPKCQTKIFNEICEIIPVWNDTINRDDVQKCTYLDCFIKETMRFIPTIPYLSRKVQSEVKIGDYTIPIGAEIFIDIWGIQTSKKIWPNADKFMPERFEGGVTAHSSSPLAYMPFGGGPRNCIGMKYANVVLKVLLIHLVRNFQFSTSLNYDDIKFQMTISLVVANENFIQIERREIT